MQGGRNSGLSLSVPWWRRCLDLYLCPRTRQKRVHIHDPKSLLSALPRPRDLQPFPNRLAKRFLGHTAKVLYSSTSFWHSSCWLSCQASPATAI